jgi:hypothetical protein
MHKQGIEYASKREKGQSHRKQVQGREETGIKMKKALKIVGARQKNKHRRRWREKKREKEKETKKKRWPT